MENTIHEIINTAAKRARGFYTLRRTPMGFESNYNITSDNGDITIKGDIIVVPVHSYNFVTRHKNTARVVVCRHTLKALRFI